jgi:cell division protein FtsN
MSEQDVHEIQLNGKQLVFMFMAATVVSVVIFLCGVMVGRGVHQPFQATPVDQIASLGVSSAPVDASADPGPTPEERLTYAERLQSTGTPKATPPPATQPAPAPAADKVTVEPPAPREAPAPAQDSPRESAAQTTSLPEPAGKGWVVQVQAFPKQADAEALAGRLKAKGFNAFVAVNPKEGPGKYRVRVGKYPNKPEAEAMAVRLRQEERFTPWVTQ